MLHFRNHTIPHGTEGNERTFVAQDSTFLANVLNSRVRAVHNAYDLDVLKFSALEISRSLLVLEIWTSRKFTTFR